MKAALILLAAAMLLSGCISQGLQGPTRPEAAGLGEVESTATSSAPAEDYREFKSADEVFNSMDEAVAAIDAPAGQPANPNGQFIVKTAEVKPGSTMDFVYEGETAILVNFNGQYAAYVNKCTHKGGPNKLEEAVVRCQWHGAEFDPSTGAVLKGPATQPLTQIPVSVVGDSVYAA